MFYQLRGIGLKKQEVTFDDSLHNSMQLATILVVKALVALRERSFDRLADDIKLMQ